LGYVVVHWRGDGVGYVNAGEVEIFLLINGMTGGPVEDLGLGFGG